MRNNYLLITLLFFFVFKISFAQININNLKKHIKFLASDKMKGRGAATQQELSAANYIRNNFSALKLEPRGNINSYYHSYKLKRPKDSNDSNDTVGGEMISSINVAAYLDNGEEHTVIIGAHYDHLGSWSDQKEKIYNGADDNASGTAGVIELARYFSQNRRKEKFNFLFICFSGEELGSIGSKKFCENPTIDLTKVNYMVNMDMIGRLNDTTKALFIYGVGTAVDWNQVIDKVSTEFQIHEDNGGYGTSDHTSFYFKKIPILCFSTGQHEDYHKPADDISRINFIGEKKSLEYIVKIIEETEKLSKLKFLETGRMKREICNFEKLN